MKSAKISTSLAMLLCSSVLNAEQIKKDPVSLEEVVVTGQKRSESEKKVPLSIATLSGDKIDAVLASGDDVQALAGQVPGLYVESSNGRIAPRFYLRGLGNVDFDLSASQPVSFIYDNVVLENVILKSTPLFDIDAVEVDRGPQGTLFGRNTTAGVVKFTSKRPTAETEAYLKTSYGTYDSINSESAIGGTLIDGTLLGRLSILAQHRSDWIDNDYTGEKDALGGMREYAGRLQLLYTPIENISALLNIHDRSLDGTQTPFRANVFTTGSNKLNSNYNRDSVFFDGGNNNRQTYTGNGGSLTIDANFDAYTLTTISAFEKSHGTNTGDIDGGVAGVGPGFIPFSSVTVDAGNVKQQSHEVRLASKAGNFWDWQVGAFYFNSDLSVFTDAGFASATVFHQDKSKAIFAHNTFNFDKIIVGAGVRHTIDDKTFHTFSTGVDHIDVSANKTTGDLSATYLLSGTTSFYTRVANGYRAPSIQGRNVAFGGAPSVAKSEDIVSFEVGFKSDLIENKLRINGAIFDYKIKNFQLSAIGGASNSNQLMNADNGDGTGFETDIEFIPSNNTKITFGYSYSKTEINDKNLVTGVCGSKQCTVTNPVNSHGFASIDGNPFPGAPKNNFNITYMYKKPYASGNIFFFTDWVYEGSNNLALYKSKEFETSGQYEGGVRFGYESTKSGYSIALFSRNVTNEDNVKGFVDFDNNTGFVNEPRIVGAEFRLNL